MKEQSIAKNYAYNLIIEVLNIAIPFIMMPYLARTIGADGVGVYSYTSSIVSYFSLFIGLGMAGYGRRLVSMKRDNKSEISKIFWELMLLRTFMFGIVLTLYLLFLMFYRQYIELHVIMIITLLSTWLSVGWFFNGLENFRITTVRGTITKLITVLFTVSFVKSKEDLLIYVLGMGIIGLFGSICVLLQVKKYIEKPVWKELKPFSHLKETLVFFIPAVATSIYTILDKTMLGFIVGDEFESGFYEQAYHLVGGVNSITISLNVVVGTRISYLFAQNKIEEIKKRMDNSIRLVFLLTIPLFIGFNTLLDDFIPLFLGDGYDKVCPLAHIMSILIIVIGISNCLGGQLLSPTNQRKRSAIVICVGAVINFILNCILIPRFASIGAAMASVIAESVIAISYLFLAWKYIKVPFVLLRCWKYFIASMFMCFYLFIIDGCINNVIVKIIIQVLGSIVIYGVLNYVLKDKLFQFIIIEIKRVILKGIKLCIK